MEKETKPEETTANAIEEAIAKVERVIAKEPNEPTVRTFRGVISVIKNVETNKGNSFVLLIVVDGDKRLKLNLSDNQSFRYLAERKEDEYVRLEYVSTVEGATTYNVKGVNYYHNASAERIVSIERDAVKDVVYTKMVEHPEIASAYGAFMAQLLK